MEVGLGLRVPATGARADVVVRCAEGTRLDEVAPRLLALVSADGPLSVGGRPLPPHAVVGEPPLVEGALVEVGAAPAPAPHPGVAELRCVAGPDAGRRWPLHPGDAVLGRQGDLRVDDADLSRAHCRARAT